MQTIKRLTMMKKFKKKFKKEFKNIFKKPLYWLFICILIIFYCIEVIPSIRIYGSSSKDMNISTQYEKGLVKLAYTNTKILHKTGLILRNRYFLGFCIQNNYDTIPLSYKNKNELKNMLNEFKENKMTYKKYTIHMDNITKSLEKSSILNHLGFSYNYVLLSSDKHTNTKEEYLDFVSYTNNLMKNTRFSQYTSIFFGDALGTILSILPIFLIAFIYKRKSCDYVAFYAALTLNIFLAVIVMTFITFFVSLKIATLYNWTVYLSDFIYPLFIWLFVSIIYVIAQMMVMSLILKNGYLSIIVQYIYSYVFVSFHIKLSSFIIRWNYSPYKG